MSGEEPTREELQKEINEVKEKLRVIEKLTEDMKKTAEVVKANVNIERVNKAFQVIGHLMRRHYHLLAEELEIKYDSFSKKFSISIMGEEVARVKEMNPETIEKLLRDREAEIAAKMFNIIERELYRVAARVADILEAYDYCRDEVEHLNSKITALEEECSCGD